MQKYRAPLTYKTPLSRNNIFCTFLQQNIFLITNYTACLKLQQINDCWYWRYLWLFGLNKHSLRSKFQQCCQKIYERQINYQLGEIIIVIVTVTSCKLKFVGFFQGVRGNWLINLSLKSCLVTITRLFRTKRYRK